MFKSKKSHGFTLIEIIIAASILVLVGVGVIAVEKQFIGSASTNKHKLQATGLAQEGINLVKAKFGSNVLCAGETGCPDNAMKIVGGATPSPGVTYYLDSGNNLQPCPDASCTPGSITPPPGSDGTTFTRKIIFP